MTEPLRQACAEDEQYLLSEIARLNKVVQVLMDRAECSTILQGSDFSLFQTTILLEDQVRSRTRELEASLQENERINRALRESEEKFRGLVNQSLVGIGMVEENRFTYANAKLADIFGYTVEEFVQLDPSKIVAKDDRSILTERIRKILADGESEKRSVYRGVRKDGSEVHIAMTGARMSVGGKYTMIFTAIDITERVRAEEEIQALNLQLRYQSVHDPLTGLCNRRYLEESLGRELIRAKRQQTPLSVIMGDIDHFKDVNDTYGHLAGDKVLTEFGRLMKDLARGSDICCRYGGEEFLLVCPDMKRENASERAEQLRIAIAGHPIPFDTALIRITASFGVASFPPYGENDDAALIAAADRALYEAKNAGRNQVQAAP